MIAEFLNYYPGYTVKKALNMYAKTFFVLVGAMYRLKGKDDGESALKIATAISGGEALQSYLDKAEERAGGNHKLLQQVRLIKGIKNG